MDHCVQEWVEEPAWEMMGGTWEGDLADCLRMWTMDKTWNLRTFDTRTHVQSAGATWDSESKMGGGAVAFLVLVSTTKEEKEKGHSLEESHVVTKGLFLIKRMERDHTSWKPGAVDQSSQEQWIKEGKRVEMERGDESFP